MRKSLTKEESDVYIKIVQTGTMDDMFDFGYVMGRAELAQESLTLLEKHAS